MLKLFAIFNENGLPIPINSINSVDVYDADTDERINLNSQDFQKVGNYIGITFPDNTKRNIKIVVDSVIKNSNDVIVGKEHTHTTNEISDNDLGITGSPTFDIVTANSYFGNFNITGDEGNILILDSSGKIIDSGINLFELTTWNSAGFITKGTITDNGDGSITIPDEYALLYQNSNFSGSIKKYLLTGGTTGIDFPSLIDNNINYVVGKYNSGSPIFDVITNVDLITESDVIPYITVLRRGNIIMFLDWDELGLGLSNKIHHWIVKNFRVVRENGLLISKGLGTVFSISEAIVWHGVIKKSYPTVTSDTDIFKLYYHSAGNWTSLTINGFNNTQYDNGTDLITLSPNNYTVNWIYRGLYLPSNPDVYVILGDTQYSTIIDANTSKPPSSLPDEIKNGAILVGRIIVKKDSTTDYEIDSAFDQTFNPASVSSHNDLANIQGGTASQYYHFTEAQHKDLTDMGDTSLHYHSSDRVRENHSGYDPVSAVKLNFAGSPVVTTVEKLIDYIFSAGSLEDITITDNLDGTIAVSSGKVLLREFGTENSKLISYTLTANSSVSLVDKTLNYLYAVVSGSTAIVQSSTTMPDLYSEALLGIIFKDGTTLYIARINQSEKDLFKNILEYNLANKMRLVSGGLLQYLGDLKFKIYEAKLYNNLKNIIFPQFYSSTQTFKYFVKQGPNQVIFSGDVNSINNTNYGDPILGFKTLTTNYYNCQWVFITENGEVYIELDTINTSDINVAIASNYQKKNIPNFLKYNSVLIAKIIAKQGSSSDIFVMQAGNNEIINFIDTIKKFSYNNLSDVPTEFPPEAHTHVFNDINGNLDDIADGTTYVRSHNDFTDTLLSKLNGIEDGAEVNDVNSVNGKTGTVILTQDDISNGTTYVRTHNDYTDAEKSKLSGIEPGAEVNDVNSVNGKTGAVSLTQDDITDGTTYVQTENNFSNTLLSKLNGIEDGAEVNNISDTNATDLTNGGDTTLHTHDSRYYTETEVENIFLKKSADSDLDMNNYHIREVKTVTASAEYDNGNSGTAKTITWTNGQFQKLTLTGNCTISFSSLASYPYPTRFQLKLIQDSTGGRTVTWSSGIKWAGKTVPTLTTDANAEDIITFYFDGTSFYGMAGTNFGTV